MKQPLLPGLRPLFLLFVAFFFLLNSQAQTKPGFLDWGTDTVSAGAAASSATKFRSDLNNAGKKATKIVTLPVDKLKEILDACSANGVTDIKAMIVTIRADDTAQYSKRNPGMTAAEKKDIIGRQTIILRVPRKAFGPSGSRINVPGNNPLMLSLLAAGMVVMDNPTGVASADEEVYFGLGIICPPPTSCDN